MPNEWPSVCPELAERFEGISTVTGDIPSEKWAYTLTACDWDRAITEPSAEMAEQLIDGVGLGTFAFDYPGTAVDFANALWPALGLRHRSDVWFEPAADVATPRDPPIRVEHAPVEPDEVAACRS